MDPLSIATAIGSIMSVSVKVGLSIEELSGKMRRAPVTLEVIKSQCELMKATLGQLQTLVMRDSCIRTQGLVATFDQTLSACNIVFKCLELDVRKLLSSANPSKRQSWIRALVARTTVVLNESSMNNYLSMLQGQQVSLGLLIQLVQLQSVDEIHLKIHERQDVLDQQSAQAHSLRDSNPQIHAPNSILGVIRSDASVFGPNSAFTLNDDLEFSFDNEVVDSRAYRHIMARASQFVRQQGKLPDTVVSNDDLRDVSMPFQLSMLSNTGISSAQNEVKSPLRSIPGSTRPDLGDNELGKLEILLRGENSADLHDFDFDSFLEAMWFSKEGPSYPRPGEISSFTDEMKRLISEDSDVPIIHHGTSSYSSNPSNPERATKTSGSLDIGTEPEQTENTPMKQPSIALTEISNSVYSKRGFDMLRTLYYVTTRPNPQVALGRIDIDTAFVVCDITMNDCPIIYVSDTYLSLIGYSRSEILGKNCRFLQSPTGMVVAGSKREFVDNGAVFDMKQKLSQGKEVQKSIINYRRGGKPFLNLLTIIPVPGDTKEIRYYCGFCIDLLEVPGATSTE